MGEFAFRRMVSCVLLLMLPGSLFAADTNAAMVYTNGATWVNGAFVPRPSSAIFAGDMLQTRSDSVANINEPGSSITVHSDSLVQYDPLSVKVEHGGVTISTSKEVGTTAGGIKVKPASYAWTEFNVVDFDGTVRIAATKGDLNIDDGSGVVTLAQGQETTRDEQQTNDTSTDASGKKKDKKRPAGASPAANGGILSSPIAIAVGGGAIIGITTWVLIKNDNPASPTQP
jgi:hypothetical protein